MKAVLFAVGVAVVVGQTCQTETNSANCTAYTDCEARAASCYRKGDMANNVSVVCDLSMMSCGTSCAAGGPIKDFKTCSTCADTCATTAMQAGNATCVGNGLNGCGWNPAGCKVKVNVTVPHCTGLKGQACTDSPNCYWLAYDRTACGIAAEKSEGCYPCNVTLGSPTGATSSALSSFNALRSRTCTWATKDTVNANPFVLKITALSQNSMCTAFAKSMGDAIDFLALSGAVSSNVFGTYPSPINSLALPTCTVAPSSAMLVGPSLSILAMVAVFLA